jgi:hypothetical protein
MFEKRINENVVPSGASPSVAEALDALWVAQDSVDAALAALESRKTDLQDVARVFLLESPEGELLDRAGKVYWSMPDVSASSIASVVFGNSKAASKLCSTLPRDSAPKFSCDGCGSDVPFASRSSVAELSRKRRIQLPVLCLECEKRKQEASSEDWRERRRVEDERISALRSMPYREYLLTEEWLNTRNRKLKQAWFKCQLCNQGGLLNVHHRTYERRGCEDMKDLIVLCHPCHAKFHGKLP